MHALLTSDPGGTGAPGHSAPAILPSAPGTASAPTSSDFGAQSHGLHLRCLRFAAAVTRTPRKTRFRAVASLTRAGLDPQDLFGRFPSDSSHVIPSPFPELCSAHARHLLSQRLDQTRTEDVQSLGDQLVGDGEGRHEADNVAPDAARQDEQAAPGSRRHKPAAGRGASHLDAVLDSLRSRGDEGDFLAPALGCPTSNTPRPIHSWGHTRADGLPGR